MARSPARLAGGDRAHGAGGLRLADHRSRARRRHRIRAARPPPRGRRDPDRRARPAAVRGAAADRSCAGSRRTRDHGPAGRHRRAGARGDLVHALSARRHPRPGAVDARRGLGELGHADVRSINPHSSASSRSSRRARSSTRRRSPPSTAWTSCSSARPTCRTASASRASSTIRATSTRSARRTRGGGRRQGGRHPARDASALGRHRELGFRFIGLGSDSAFIAAGARAVLREARKA